MIKKVLSKATVLVLPLVIVSYSSLSFAAETEVKGNGTFQYNFDPFGKNAKGPLSQEEGEYQKVTDVNGDSAFQYDFDPFSPKAKSTLEQYDREYEELTGLKAFITSPQNSDGAQPGDESGGSAVQPQITDESAERKCRREQCHIFIDVEKSRQVLNLYRDGELILTTRTSTGRPGTHATPNFDTNPNGRIYQIYSSKTYPGYNNMPFAVFIQGGFAIHGAPGKEDSQLGTPVSHGCVRVRTSVAQQINQIISKAVVQNNGSTKNVWITVRN